MMTSENAARPSPMPELAAYIAGALHRPLPAEVQEKARFQLLDTLAAMVSGSRLPPGRKAIEYLKVLGKSDQACVAGTSFLATAIDAALVNGMLAHADETDDSHAESLTHPGCGIVPAALAAADLYERSGAELLRAIVLGYDVCCRMSLALGAYEFRAAGHSSHTFGPNFGAAAAAGALAGVNETQARYVLSYAAQQASGVSCWMRDKDHIEKAFDFGGMAARNGVTAALMVSSGFTGVDDVFSGERCFFDAYGNDADRDILIRGLGSRYEILETSIKRWTVGSPIQAPLDALHALLAAHEFSPADVAGITVRIPHESLTIVNDRDMPEICLQHLIAVMLLDGTLGFATAHDRGRMADPAVRALRSRVRLFGDDELSRAMPVRQGIVELKLNDGRAVTHHTQAVRGTPPNPMSPEEVRQKASDLMAPVLGAEGALALCDAVWRLAELDNVRKLRPLMQA
ncbi:MmgE/PrpD family protein [Candidimonas humi]|uniref:MmgE/PrpD family protein n=1 Tax=Candidimonas humi TaxID=683355 RepID=A0ABV8NVK6_9BURK|nr:MmgE/PrpD family protein [Candidimonas humi]MBV6303284.1 MmgE/PrpD family protein [Candidimonas humi]